MLCSTELSKIHDKEFEILPVAWVKLQEALGRAQKLTSFVKEYPDISGFDNLELDDLLNKFEFDDIDKRKVHSASDKQTTFQKLVDRSNLRNALSCVSDLHNYLIFNKIFLEKDTYEKFGEIDNYLHQRVKDFEFDFQYPDTVDKRDLYKQIPQEIIQTSKDLEDLIQKRLHYHDAK